MKNMQDGFKASNIARMGNISHCCSEIELSKSQEEELLSWEALMKDRYLVSLQQEQKGNMERRVQETVQKYKRPHSCAVVSVAVELYAAQVNSISQPATCTKKSFSKCNVCRFTLQEIYLSSNMVFLFYGGRC